MGLLNQIKGAVRDVEKKTDKKTLEKFGMDIEKYSDEEIKKWNTKNIRTISGDLVAIGWDKLAASLTFNAAQRGMIKLLSALVSQNWILIRQNEMILRNLK